MLTKLSLLLLSLPAIAFACNLNQACPCQAGYNSISYPSEGTTLNFYSQAQGTVTLAGVGSAPSSLPSGCHPVNVGNSGHCGYSVASGGGAALSQVQIVSQVAAESQSQINSGSPAGCLQYNGGGNYDYNRISSVSYNSGTGQCTSNLPSTGTVIYAAIDNQIQAASGQAVQLAGNCGQQVQVAGQATVAYASSVPNTMTCTVASAPSVGASAVAQAGIALGSYVSVAMANSAAYTASIAMTYSSLELLLAGVLNAAGLRIGAYSGGCGCWQFPSSGYSVDLASSTVAQAFAGTGSSLPVCGTFLPL